MKDKEKQIEFKVIDNNTGKEADIGKIALTEDWAKDLIYCDMEGFSINEDGQLILSDECGKFVYCPSDRFTVVFENSVVLTGLELADYKYYKEYTKSLAMVEKEITEKIIMDFYHELITSFKGRVITYDSFCKIAQKHNIEIPRETFTLAELEAKREDVKIKEN